MIFYVTLIYVNLIFRKKYRPGKEHNKFKMPYIIDTLILADADKPRSNESKRAVNSRIPQPPILMGKVIEKRIIGEKTMNAK